VLRGDGSGRFVSVTVYAAADVPEGVAVGDFNGDGLADVALAHYSADLVSVRLGHGDGTLGPSIWFDLDASTVLARDLTGDGRSDVLVVHGYGDSVSLLRNETRPTLQIASLGEGVKISWPDWTGWGLECSTNVALPNGWSAVPISPGSLGGRNAVTNRIDGATKFFRLREL